MRTGLFLKHKSDKLTDAANAREPLGGSIRIIFQPSNEFLQVAVS
jgi:hypothetical protein